MFRRLLPKNNPPCLSFSPFAALRQQLHSSLCACRRALNTNQNPAQSGRFFSDNPFSALRFVLLFLALCSLSANAAGPNALNFDNGEGYARITPPQPTQDPDKIEVIEFFWYGCPHCYRLEPFLHDWLKTPRPNVQFIRQPAVFGPKWAPHARAYFTAEALGVVDNIHADLFDTIQNKRRPLNTEEELTEFFVEHGVDKDQFREAYHSFVVDTKMRQAGAMSARYGVTGVPAVIINGKYKTNGTLAKNFTNLINVMNYLIASESTDEH